MRPYEGELIGRMGRSPTEEMGAEGSLSSMSERKPATDAAFLKAEQKYDMMSEEERAAFFRRMKIIEILILASMAIAFAIIISLPLQYMTLQPFLFVLIAIFGAMVLVTTDYRDLERVRISRELPQKITKKELESPISLRDLWPFRSTLKIAWKHGAGVAAIISGLEAVCLFLVGIAALNYFAHPEGSFVFLVANTGAIWFATFIATRENMNYYIAALKVGFERTERGET